MLKLKLNHISKRGSNNIFLIEAVSTITTLHVILKLFHYHVVQGCINILVLEYYISDRNYLSNTIHDIINYSVLLLYPICLRSKAWTAHEFLTFNVKNCEVF